MSAGDPDNRFADVLNGFSLNFRSGGHAGPSSAESIPPRPVPAHAAEPDYPVEQASSVRAYAWTGGRTRSNYRMEIETLVSTSARALEKMWELKGEHQEVAELCRQSKSVAEVGALLRLPLGIAKVLLGDMAMLGLITVHESNSTSPDMELLERVLRGLTNLRT
ncbi:DUF742 domain-containing protein [Kibdelosporangium philippinense]|uniref:DUF742 domain-containing protein n=1 Tax=Kibdelosporangium philippinense TaxID=211113 RepID=A0ABS8ZCK4_9PSEU|nr:DUF742 domain-containing protein [Kibdelosporangium philippinense]MCE7003567.1 DUF742 domain-containing protein [Kibdelosporangium philippinense]